MTDAENLSSSSQEPKNTNDQAAGAAADGARKRGLFRKAVIILIILTIPLVILMATRYGEVQSVTFERSLEIAKGRTEIEPRYKLVIEAIVTIDDQHPFEGGDGNASFHARDREGQHFFVSYDGGEKIEVTNGMQVKLAGHTHEGNPPWFHCSEVITDY